MSAFTTSAVNGGVRVPASVDLTCGIVVAGSANGTVFDAAQALQSSQPSDPLVHMTTLPVPNGWSVPSGFLGVTAHRWPFGTSAAPNIPYSVVRSHDYQPSGDSLYWVDLEKSAGVWSWSLFDSWINAHKQTGVEVILNVGCTPSFYAGTVPAFAVGREVAGTGSSVAPTDMTKWTGYITAVVNRAVNVLGLPAGKLLLELWNEPHPTSGFSHYYYSDTWAKMAEMTRLANLAAKAVNASVRIISTAVSKIEAFGRGEMASMLDASAVGLSFGGNDGTATTCANWIDVLGLHSYATADTLGYNYGQSIFSNMASVITLRDARACVGKPIWNTEIGYIDAAKATENVKIKRIVRLLTAAACSGCNRVVFYSWDNVDMGIDTSSAAQSRINQMVTALAGKSVSGVVADRDGTLTVRLGDGSVFIV